MADGALPGPAHPRRNRTRWGRRMTVDEARQFADYIEPHRFQREQIEDILKDAAEGFVQEMRPLITLA